MQVLLSKIWVPLWATAGAVGGWSDRTEAGGVVLSRSAVLTDYASGPRVVDLDVRALKPGEILVEIDAAPVCETDVNIVAGRFPQQSALPLIMGQEGTGRILETKGRVADVNGRPLEPGERIVWAHPWCGHCFSCAIAEEPTMCESTFGYGWGPSSPGQLNGTFSEYFIVEPESKVLVVPGALDPALVAVATGDLCTVMHAMTRIARLKFSDQVVVLGSGPVGLYAAAVALASGAAGVHLLGGSHQGLSLTAHWGLATSFDCSTSSPMERQEEIIARTGGRGVDVVIGCDQTVQALENDVDIDRRWGLLRPGGIYLALDPTLGDKAPITTNGSNRQNHSVGSTFSAGIVHFYEAIAFLERYAERFSLAEMVAGRRYTLDETSLALGALRSGEELKPVILPTT